MLNIDTDKIMKTACEQLGVYEPHVAKARYQINKERLRDKYQFEKVIGRRKDNGLLKLQELRPIHQHIIAMHLQGMKSADIALEVGCSMITVHKVINDPKAQGIITAVRDGYWQDLEALFPLVINTIRDGLTNGSIETRLKAVAAWGKMTGNQQADNQVNVNVSLVAEAREKLVNGLADARKRLELVHSSE